MRFDFVALLGGLALGATGAALFEAARSKRLLGWSGGGPGGGPGGGFGGGSYAPGGGSYAPGGFGPGVVSGPPGGSFGGPTGPFMVNMAPEEEVDGTGPIVSVPPIIHDGDGSFGDSFFGVNVAPWFWPLNVLPVLQWPAMPREEEIICKKGEDKETLICRRRYPVQSVAWGPPPGWL